MTTAQLYQSVTDSIVAQLEAGNLAPWRCPWQKTGNGFPLRHNGVAYRGVNVLLLWMTSQAKGYGNPHFLTFNQARDYGGNVKKGEKSTTILFCQPFQKEETAEDGNKGKGTAWMALAYHVFNVEQIDGLPERFTAQPVHHLDEEQRLAHADTFIANTGADIHHGNGSAFYHPSLDYISLPYFPTFTSPEAYAATALHELAHWTGHASRLDRDLKGFGNKEAYSREEIVAELASVFLCSSLGIAPLDLGQHATYIGHWIAALKADPKYLFTAASKAQQIADYLHSLQPAI